MRARAVWNASCVFGLVIAATVPNVGCHKPLKPLTLSCWASPAAVLPGEPVTVISSSAGMEPTKCAMYSWTGDGVSANGRTASVATGSLAPGTHTVKGELSECKVGESRENYIRRVECETSFTVKAIEPPSIGCTASPNTIRPGETSTVTAIGVSPQNRPLTFSYSASAGTISGSGTQAVYSAAGAPVGAVAINCNVSDDKSQTATASTFVTIVAPYVPPVPHAQTLCSISFENDKKRPTRADNVAKACLDEVALNLQRQSDAKAVVVGEAVAAEKTPKKGSHATGVKDFAAQRAVNVKEYLVVEKGIDASRVGLAKGVKDAQTVENYLVPSGANFNADVFGTSEVNETAVKPEERKPLAQRHAHK